MFIRQAISMVGLGCCQGENRIRLIRGDGEGLDSDLALLPLKDERSVNLHWAEEAKGNRRGSSGKDRSESGTAGSNISKVSRGLPRPHKDIWLKHRGIDWLHVE